MRLTVERADPRSDECSALIDELSDALFAITGNDGRSSFDDPDDPDLYFAIARIDGVAAGCGALRRGPPGAGEIKRMYARKPGYGIGKAVLNHLESEAARRGMDRLVLSTRRVNRAAVDFYLAQGFAPCAPYGRYVGRERSICLERQISRP